MYPGRSRLWLRTAEGRLIVLTALLAIAAAVVYVVKPSGNPPEPASPAGEGPPIMRDLRAGMRHNAFLEKYGKAERVELRPDGLLRLYYRDVIVTFDGSGYPIEVVPR
ncbi:MAG TPA: hypothetical protein VMI31_10385 [Fimbriimonadaceae bacterium]|nr:hypothetical protein [Fimbriimonadaceae bacterium]